MNLCRIEELCVAILNVVDLYDLASQTIHVKCVKVQVQIGVVAL